MAAPKGNRYAIGNRGGRPPKYETAEKLAKEIDRYFEYILGEEDSQMIMVTDPITQKQEIRAVKYWKRKPEKATMFGAILFLGFSSLHSLDHYGEQSDEFLTTISSLKARIAKWYEECLTEKGIARGAAFALSAIVGWGNKTEVQYLDKNGQKTDAPAGVATIFTQSPNTQKEL